MAHYQGFMHQDNFRDRIERIELAQKHRPNSQSGSKQSGSKIRPRPVSDRQKATRAIRTAQANKPTSALLADRFLPALLGVLIGMIVSIVQWAVFIEIAQIGPGSPMGDVLGLVMLGFYPLALLCLIVSLFLRHSWPGIYFFSLGLVTTMVVGALV